jgi:hypothetical protein
MPCPSQSSCTNEYNECWRVDCCFACGQPPQAGLLRTERGELWMEPVRGHSGGPGMERPHIVFKRSAAHDAKKRKRKRKKRHEKNCGTRGE